MEIAKVVWHAWLCQSIRCKFRLVGGLMRSNLFPQIKYKTGQTNVHTYFLSNFFFSRRFSLLPIEQMSHFAIFELFFKIYSTYGAHRAHSVKIKKKKKLSQQFLINPVFDYCFRWSGDIRTATTERKKCVSNELIHFRFSLNSCALFQIG